MLPFQNQNSSNQNPFSGYQKFYLNLFAAVKGESEKEYQKGVNDTMHFKLSVALDNEMLKNSEIRAKAGKRTSYDLQPINSVKGYLKSITTYKEIVDSKPTHKIKITLFDPKAPYHNPFQDINSDNKLNGTVTGAIYDITTSYSLKGKELLSKLSNIDFTESNEMVEIIIVPAKNKDDGYKSQVISNGRKVYNILIKQGDNIIRERFGNPEKSSYVKHDKYNEQYLENIEKYEDETLRINMDALYRSFILDEISGQVHELFLGTLRSVLECDLVENGVDSEGKPKLKYVSLKNEAVSEDNFVTVDDDDEDNKSFKQSLDETLAVVSPAGEQDYPDSPESDDLPF